MHYLVIGHICQDITPKGRVLGGTATYAALTAYALGWTTTVVTRAADDLDLSQLRGIACARLPSDRTTTFENIYTPSGRVQILHAAAGPIRSADLPAQSLTADVVHLGPIVDEVDPELAGSFPHALVGVTPQGWLRQWGASGRVTPRAWVDAEIILSRAGAVVTSLDDVGGDWSVVREWTSYAQVVVATQGRDGCTVYVRGVPTHVSAPSVSEVDATGAGDIFAATFFIRLQQTGDPIASARFANCIAAGSVRRRGLDGAPAPADVHACRD